MIKIGITGPSEIAIRRFLPALQKVRGITFAGVAIASQDEWSGASDLSIASEYKKAEVFIQKYGGRIYKSYGSLIEDKDIDAIYIPLPPALHFKWAQKALKKGKHVFVEKPSTTCSKDTAELVELAKGSGLALHENYMFVYHRQIQDISNIISSGELGQIRLYRVSFGFPQRLINDFRYVKQLGGGALLDCGGYTLKYAALLLGNTVKVACSSLSSEGNFDVDIFGSGTLMNDNGMVVQVSFGMDNSYKCDLEVWGSKGSLKSGRVLTAPVGFIPDATIQSGNEVREIKLSEDDSFMNSIIRFKQCMEDDNVRSENYDVILQQSLLVDEFLQKSKIVSNGQE